MKRSVISIVLAVVMCLMLLPIGTFALDQTTVGAGTEQPVCNCETKCSVGKVNTNCPVCGGKAADLMRCLGAVPSTQSAPGQPSTQSTAGQPSTQSTAAVSEALQALYDLVSALPEATDITDANREAVNGQMEAIFAALDKLTEEEQAVFDQSTACVKLYAVNDALIGETPVTYPTIDMPKAATVKIGSSAPTEYETFAEAWNAAVGSESTDTITVTLLADVTATTDETYGTSFGTGTGFYNGIIQVPKEKTITLDLKNCKLDRGLGSSNIQEDGAVILNNGTLTIQSTGDTGNGKITGGNNISGDNCGGGIYNTGTLELISGNITGNIASGGGGGIYNSGTLTISGGSITSNHAFNGGGIYNLSTGTLTITGGSITGNTGNTDGGGGIYNNSQSGALTISGNPVVSGNTGKSNAIDNLYLNSDAPVAITAALTEGANIGIKMKTPGVFTSGTSVTNSNYLSYFSSDDSNCRLQTSDKQLTLIPARNITKQQEGEGYFAVTVGEDDTDVDKAFADDAITIVPYPDTGYVLDKIEVTKTGGSETVTVDNNSFTMPDYDVTVTVTFRPITFTVVYDGNGATSGTMDSVRYTYGSGKTLTANGFKKKDYYFTGWATTSDAQSAQYTAQELVSNLTCEDGETVTLYAVWEKKKVVNVPIIRPKVYNGKLQTADVNTIEGVKIVSNGGGTDVGDYDVVLALTDAEKYEWNSYNVVEIKRTFTIKPLDISSNVTIGAFNLTYTGSAQIPTATVTKDVLTIAGNWSAVTNVTDTSTFTPTSSNFTGTIADQKTYMAAMDITGATVGAFTAMTYTGSAQAPTATVTKDGLPIAGNWSDVTNVADISTFTPTDSNFTGTITRETGMAKAVVSSFDLSSFITAPVKNGSPQSEIVDQEQYTGTISWNGSPTKFLGKTVYTATLSLTATDNYTFTGVEANKFSSTGATVTNSANSGTVTLVFPATEDRSAASIRHSGTPTQTRYNIGEAFNPAGLTLTVTYDDGTTQVFSGSTNADYIGFSASPVVMEAATTSVTLKYGGATTSEAISGLTVRENLTSITTPAAIGSLTNGKAKTVDALGLPQTVGIVTSTGVTKTATVTWDVTGVNYDEASLEAQTFTVNGTVTLPADMSNVLEVPLSTTVSVSVNAATPIQKPEQNTASGSADTAESISGITTGEQVLTGSTLTITVDEFVRGDKTYIPVAWATNPSGKFTNASGTTYSATVETANMKAGEHTFTIAYREVASGSRTATGNMVETVIDYTIKAVSGGSYPYRPSDAFNDFWQAVVNQINTADSGDTVTVSAGSYNKLPSTVMQALAQHSGVSLIVNWNGGDTITIPAGMAPTPVEGQTEYLFSYLARQYADASLKPEKPAQDKPAAENKDDPQSDGEPATAAAPEETNPPIAADDPAPEDVAPTPTDVIEPEADAADAPAVAEPSAPADAASAQRNGLLPGALAVLVALAVLAGVVLVLVVRKKHR